MAMDTKMRNRPQRQPKHIRVSSLSQRSYHKEPYPPSPTRDLDHKYSGGLLPTPSTSSPTRHKFSSSVAAVPLAFKQSLSDATTGSAAFGEASKPNSVTTMLVPLFFYFSLNLCLTLYNKLVLVRFPFPYTLTALHALAGTLGANLLVHSPSLALSLSLPRKPLSIRNLSLSSLLYLPPFLARYTWRLRRLWRRVTDRFGSAREHRPLTNPTTVPVIPGVELSRSGDDVTDPFYHSTHSGAQSRSGGSASHRQPYSERLSDTLRGVDDGAPVPQEPLAKKNNLDLTPKEALVIVAFSVLYTINIVVSNMSLGLVTVPFHQVVRSSAPFFTIALSTGLLGQRASKAKVVSLIPVIAGVGFATYGDYYFTPWGFALTLLGTLLAALKTVITYTLQAPGRASQSSAPRNDEKLVSNVISPARSIDGRHNSPVGTPYRTGSPWMENFNNLSDKSSRQHTHRQNLTLSDLFPRSPSHSPGNSVAGLPSDSSVGSHLSVNSAVGHFSGPMSMGGISGSISSDGLSVNGVLQPSSSFQTSSSASSIFVAPSPSPSSRIIPSSPLVNAPLVNSPTSSDSGSASGSRFSASPMSRTQSQPETLTSSSSSMLLSLSTSSSAERRSVDRAEEERSDLKAFRFPRARAVTPPPPYSLTDSGSGSGSVGFGLANNSEPGDVVSQSGSTSGICDAAHRFPVDDAPVMNGNGVQTTDAVIQPPLSYPATELDKHRGSAATGHKGLLRPLSPLDLLLLTSPLAFIQCVLIAHFTGELDRVRHYSQHEMNRTKLLALLANGLIAFGLNVVSFTANKKIGALGMSVAANVKQVLTILIAVVIFDLTITGMNAVGIVLTLLGGAWYARVEYEEKLKKGAV